MYKIIHLIKRKSHLTHEQFREHFERSHAAMAIKYCGHLFSEYRRNYVNQVFGGGDSRQEGSGYGPMAWNWDLLSEWILASEENLHEIYRIMESPGIRRLFLEDEDRIIDRKATVTMPCAVFDVGTVFNPKGTVFDTLSGEPSWEGYENWTPSR
jgi:hypothetical protein